MDIPRCNWPTGTVYTGPQTCGKPAKFLAVAQGHSRIEPNRAPRNVCGVHARSARRENYDLTSLEGRNP